MALKKGYKRGSVEYNFSARVRSRPSWQTQRRRMVLIYRFIIKYDEESEEREYFVYVTVHTSRSALRSYEKRTEQYATLYVLAQDYIIVKDPKLIEVRIGRKKHTTPDLPMNVQELTSNQSRFGRNRLRRQLSNIT